MKDKKSGPTFIREGDVVSMLGDRQDVKDRKADAARCDCRLDSKKVEVVSEWDNSQRKLVRPVNYTLLTFVRNVGQETRGDAHWEATWKVVHDEVQKVPEGTQLSIVINDSDGKGTAYIPRGYVQAAYEVCTLGKFRKGTPEVESLLAEEGVT